MGERAEYRKPRRLRLLDDEQPQSEQRGDHDRCPHSSGQTREALLMGIERFHLGSPPPLQKSAASLDARSRVWG